MNLIYKYNIQKLREYIFKMYFDNTLLTLMVTTLFLAPGLAENRLGTDCWQKDDLAKTKQKKDAERSKSGEEQNQAQFPVRHLNGYKELENILEKADTTEKLCLCYIVSNNNSYDDKFNKLASKFTSTEFMKIDVTKYSTKNYKPYEIDSEPTIIFFKYRYRIKALFGYDEEVIKNKIQELEKLERRDFITRY